MKLHRLAPLALFFATLLPLLFADIPEGDFVIHRDIDPKLERVRVSLRAIPQDEPRYPYTDQQAQAKDVSQELNEAYPDHEYIHQFIIGHQDTPTAIDVLLTAAVNEVKSDEKNYIAGTDRNTSNRSEYYALILKRDVESEERTILDEGWTGSGFRYGHTVSIPVKSFGENGVNSVLLSFGIHLYGSNNNAPYGQMGLKPLLNFEGDRLYTNGQLLINFKVPAQLKPTRDMPVSLSFRPLNHTAPVASKRHEISKPFELGNAVFAVESIADDFSAIQFALLHGGIESLKTAQVQPGANLPPMSQVDLLSRKLVTRQSLYNDIKEGRNILFIFGELTNSNNTSSRYGGNPFGQPGQPGFTPTLNLQEEAIVRLASDGVENPPKVIFVVRTIPFELLYETYLDKIPDHLYLSDFSDVTEIRVTQRQPDQNRGGVFQPAQLQATAPGSLRNILGLPSGTISLILYNGDGEAVFIHADAGEHLSQHLYEINELLLADKTE